MPDYQTAYLLIDDGDGTTATFELNRGFEETTEGEKNFIMANRGQFITEVDDHTVDVLTTSDVVERRAGWWLDGGSGSITFTLSFETGLEDVSWGDGSGGDGPSNLTQTDASGADVKPLPRKQVLDYWLTKTRTDSYGQARLHWGEWTDGSISGVTAGVYGEPIPVAIQAWNLPTADVEEGPSSFSGTLTMSRVNHWPDTDLPDWVSDPAGQIAEMIEGLQDR